MILNSGRISRLREPNSRPQTHACVELTASFQSISYSWEISAMTYPNKIFGRAFKLLLVTQRSPDPPLFQVNPQWCSDQIKKGKVRLFSASCVHSRCGWKDHLPGCWVRAGGVREAKGIRREEGGGKKRGRGERRCGGTQVRKKEEMSRVWKRRRKKERRIGKERSKALQRHGGNATGEEADRGAPSSSRPSLAHAPARPRAQRRFYRRWQSDIFRPEGRRAGRRLTHIAPFKIS